MDKKCRIYHDKDGSGLQFIKFDFVTGGSGNQTCHSCRILRVFLAVILLLCFHHF